MQAGDQVYEKVDGKSGAIVAVIPPAKEPLGIPRMFRRAALKLGPVAGTRVGIGGDRILPCADGGVTVEPRLNHVELADSARFVELMSFQIHQRAAILAP